MSDCPSLCRHGNDSRGKLGPLLVIATCRTTHGDHLSSLVFAYVMGESAMCNLDGIAVMTKMRRSTESFLDL